MKRNFIFFICFVSSHYLFGQFDNIYCLSDTSVSSHSSYMSFMEGRYLEKKCLSQKDWEYLSSDSVVKDKARLILQKYHRFTIELVPVGDSYLNPCGLFSINQGDKKYHFTIPHQTFALPRMSMNTDLVLNEKENSDFWCLEKSTMHVYYHYKNFDKNEVVKYQLKIPLEEIKDRIKDDLISFDLILVNKFDHRLSMEFILTDDH